MENVSVPQWTEKDSKDFIDFGQYFVPDRELQTRIIADLVGSVGPRNHVVDLCCGDGRLCEVLLERIEDCKILGLDLSSEMLGTAMRRLTQFGNRFSVGHFDLAKKDWRIFEYPVSAFVSSLAIHHLDDGQKYELFVDLFRSLEEGGIVVIADIIQPTTEAGVKAAGEMWDENVKERSLKIGGNMEPYREFERLQWNSFTDPNPDPVDKMSPLFSQLKWLEAAGFVSVDVHWMKAGHAVFSGKKHK